MSSLVAAVGAQEARPEGALGGQSTGARCRIDGHVMSGATPLPGVAIVARAGDAIKAATSSDLDGRYTVLFAPDATYHLTVELTAFARVDRDVVVTAAPCDATIDFDLRLTPRGESVEQRSAAGAAGGAARSNAPESAPQAGGGRGARGGRGAAAAAQGGQAGQAGQRFQTLNVQSDANGAATVEGAAPSDESADLSRLLPAGFSAQSVQADAVAISGNGDATSLDRGALNDRFQAVQLGQLDPTTGQFAGPGLGGIQGFPGGAAPGQNGPGAGGRIGGPGGRGGPGGFVLGGRGARGQSPYQGNANYTFGGSALNTPPFQLRPDVAASEPGYNQNTAGFTFGGPIKIPGLYADANRRSNFQFNYTGNRSNNVFDQYATVPTDAMRSGDFSAIPIQLYDPTTGQPFAGNQIPQSRMDPTALALLGFIPAPNLAGTSKNYHVSTTALSTSEAMSLRFTQNLSPNVTQPGGRGGALGGRGGGGRGGAFAGRGGAGARGTNIVLSAQLQYRKNDTEALSVFPGLGSQSTNTSVTVPVSLNVVRGRTVNNFSVNFAHASQVSTNAFSGVDDVSELAGINYPASVNPLNYGVPTLSFSGFNSLRGPSASTRTDDRVTASYFWSKPVAKHQLRIGGDYRFDTTSTENNGNARGTFTFTGVYSSANAALAGANGADFADFLLGAPQQASLQVGGVTRLHGHSFDAYIEDNWQASPKLTLNLGLRYELVLPYVEVNGHMANLDVAPGFTAVSTVTSGGVGPFTGAFPAGLINVDSNNIGPRIGAAYRVAPGTILRGGYSITYNPSSYAAIARQLVAQPPFASTETIVTDANAPLSLSNALVSSSCSTSSNCSSANYGVDRNYTLGQIQTWNASLSRNLSPVWAVITTYTGVKGSDLDLLSAPNRGPAGLLIPTVQPFIWESSGGRSTLQSANVQLLRRLAHGVSGSASYTLAKSMDNTPSLGAGSTTVAQNPQDLGAEWALSNFDRRHQFTGNLTVELPFGPNRRWLSNGGLIAAAAGGWSSTLTFTAQSGTPLTARVVGAASNIAQGVNGALRADYTGAPIAEADPTLGEFFNTAAFTAPESGFFGTSPRNIIIGPGGHQLNMSFLRDIRLGGNRALTLQVNATNLLNTIEWAAVDTNINSLTFGQVTSVRPMRVVTVNARFRF